MRTRTNMDTVKLRHLVPHRFLSIIQVELDVDACRKVLFALATVSRYTVAHTHLSLRISEGEYRPTSSSPRRT
jgi:hypothetical protein